MQCADTRAGWSKQEACPPGTQQLHGCSAPSTTHRSKICNGQPWSHRQQQCTLPCSSSSNGTPCPDAVRILSACSHIWTLRVAVPETQAVQRGAASTHYCAHLQSKQRRRRQLLQCAMGLQQTPERGFHICLQHSPRLQGQHCELKAQAPTASPSTKLDPINKRTKS